MLLDENMEYTGSIRIAGGNAATIILFFVLVFMLATAVHAQTEEIFQKTPDYLEPINPYKKDVYSQIVFRALIEGRDIKLWMISKSSFLPEFAIMLKCDIEYFGSDDEIFDRKIKSKTWILEYAELKKSIWDSKELKKSRKILSLKSTVPVERVQFPINQLFAGEIIEAWSIVKDAKYSQKGYRGLDGTTFQFNIDGYYGEIWSPREGAPRRIADLGIKLAKLVKGNNAERNIIMAECRELILKITQ